MPTQFPLVGADLRPYQAPTRVASPLESLIQGISQGEELAQAPQKAADQELMRQLNNALLRQKLYDLQNPDAALARQLKRELMIKSADPRSGVVPIVEGQNAVDGTLVALPGTITPEREAQINQAEQAAYASRPPKAPTSAQPEGTLEQPTNFAPPAEPFPEQIAPYQAPNLGGGRYVAAQETPSAYSLDGKNLGYAYDPNKLRQLKAQDEEADIRKFAQEQAIRAKFASTNFTPIGMSADGKSIVGYNHSSGAVESKPIPQESLGAGKLGALPNKSGAASQKMRGYDTKTGAFGIFEADENGLFPDGVVPATNAPKPTAQKPPSSEQVDQLAGMSLLQKKIQDIRSSPKSVRAANVGIVDSPIQAMKSAIGVGNVAQNEAFRNAVDALVAEFSFGRGGKSFTVNEREILAKYVPTLTNSDKAFEARLDSFERLVNDLKNERLNALRDSGYNVSGFDGGRVEQTPVNSGTPSPSQAPSKFKVVGVR